MFIPEVLQNAADKVADHYRILVLQPWNRLADNRWTLEICARLSVPESASIPTETNWYLLFDPANTSVTVFPAKVGGITATHQHQSLNLEGPANVPWRQGNPCLHRRAAVFGRTTWAGEPESITDKIWWYLERLLVWIDAAAIDELAVPGEPLELPPRAGQTSFPVVGFTNSVDDLQFWQAMHGQWGWADLARLPRSLAGYGISVFRDKHCNSIREPKWGRLISTQGSSATAFWVALDRLPVMPPWELPRTWAALSSCFETVRVDLAEVLVRAGADRRHRTKDSGPVTMLLGFPLSHTIGDPPSRYHWLAIGGAARHATLYQHRSHTFLKLLHALRDGGGRNVEGFRSLFEAARAHDRRDCGGGVVIEHN